MSTAFPNGISSGDVTQTSAVLWTHAVEEGQLKFQIATDPSFHHVVKTKHVNVNDPLVPVKAEFGHLAPNTQYYYRAIDADGNEITGTFETSAKLGTHDGFHFGVGGDWAGELAPYVSLKNAAGADLDVYIKLGDTIYADLIAATHPTFGFGIFLPDPGGTTTLEEFQLKHDTVYSDQLGFNYWADLQSTTPIMAMIDDHEVIDNFFGGAAPGTDTRFDQQGDFINETQLFANGLQAFSQFNAIEDSTYKNTGDDLFDGAPDLYRYNTYGSDAAIIMLDQRTFRDEETPGGGLLPANPVPFLIESFNPDRSMLGETQFERLQQDLLDARDNGTTWKFVMLPEPIQNNGPVLFPEDRYEGYAAERAALLKFIDENHIENVVFVSSDAHWLSVNNVTYQEFPFSSQIASSTIDVTTMAVGTVPIAPLIPPQLVGAPPPFGLTPAQLAFYNSLPNAPDSDSIPNDKDDFVKGILNGAINLFGYDPIGLSSTQATLLAGDYFVGHSFGWTDFNIDGTTGELVVTTYGVPAYTTQDLASNPAAVLALNPTIVSQFALTATSNNILGTADKDDLQGTNANDVLLGAGGKDELKGNGGNDYIDGGEGKDDVFGGQGDDKIFGRDGNDNLDGQAGNDQLEGGPGGDKLDGGKGLDTASYAQATSGVTADLNKSSNNKGDAAGDKYESIENLLGSRFDDRLVGNNSANVLNGGDGDDTLIGNGGNDTLIGGAGADILNSGNGQDVLVYQSLFFAGVDLIQGFSVPNDTLAFSAAGFGGGLVAGQQLVAGTTFVSNTAPVATTPVGIGAFLYDTDGQDLSYDADGSGSGAALQLAHFDTAAALTPDDFTILA
jgi:phosphodiesterase/alkaline phosphatase D-like protein